MSALYNFWQNHQKRKILEHSYCQIFQHHIYVCDSLGPNVTSMYAHENKYKNFSNHPKLEALNAFYTSTKRISGYIIFDP